MNIAVVNWRDPWHPAAGGAETYAWEMARRLAAAGHTVHFVTARAPGQRAREEIDGVRLARMGGPFSVYARVLAWLLPRRSRFDAVLDCQNGIPFFTPWVLPRRTGVICVVHHVHDRQFGVHLPRWLAAVGRFLEGPVSRWTYRRHRSVAVSPSTVEAMRERLGWTGPIHIVPNGVSVGAPAGISKSAAPRLVCVGRLVAHKRVDLLIDAVTELRERWPGLTVDVVGRGPEEARLRARLPEGVTMHGYLSEADKERLIASAWLQVNASQGEGWGLCVLEAAALGVPTVAFDVDGLRDAVRHGETGWLLPEGTDLAKGVSAALDELAGGRADAYADRCRSWAARFSWQSSAERMAELIRGRPAPAPMWAVPAPLREERW
ncbi:glycosyltransferase family 4 protein [Nonomuraea roseoviolacea]|uniref:Glycosyltransferase involved in cell wall biosynthesis n=1 Tax=Nonomuraea roseoviolacea subsp. carminata TaxID=160689 RepID=A0ABT1JVG7_9ACTN|nr:glycosyltransferase family 4 protein [Nonomuraea roseoviolacea]MCP2345751.1 glycosyltransferase involved in cell wall biosynthesis [Nonomuraea roseoviolacea subsp. carminata]